MKKKNWIIAAAVVGAVAVVLALMLGLAYFSGEESLLLSCLPRGEWLEFEGGCGNPTNPGKGLNLDDYREKCSVPENVLDTTPENIRSVLEGVTVRGGKFLQTKGDYFQYDFLTEAGEACRIRIYKNGSIVIWIGDSFNSRYLHDGGQTYRTLDKHFASIHELREWMTISPWEDMDAGGFRSPDESNR